MVATSSLVLGGLLGSWFTVGKRTLGAIMGFGAGVLISAVSFEMVFEAVALGKGSGAPTVGFVAGGLTFFFSDRLIAKLGGGEQEATGSTGQSSLVVPMVLAMILDGIPESAVIGLGILETGTVSIAMLIAVFISNLPEAIAGTTGMKASGWSRRKTLALWALIAVVCGLATVAGFSLFANVPKPWLAFLEAFAAGAILVMLSTSMMPEAYENGGKPVGLFTMLGFAVSVFVILFERSAS
jgi:ZIP family zinc transporter